MPRWLAPAYNCGRGVRKGEESHASLSVAGSKRTAKSVAPPASDVMGMWR